MNEGSKARQVAAAGVIAAVVIACGDAAVEGTGRVMQDAGGWLSDAGEAMREGDGGAGLGGSLMDAMMATGGDMLGDAGQMLRDAGSQLQDGGSGGMAGGGRGALIDGAAAQNGCGSCSAGQRQMIITADQDTAQLRGGTVERSGWTLNRGPSAHSATCNGDLSFVAHTATLADGPLVLTDVYIREQSVAQGVALFAVPRGRPCVEQGVSRPLSHICGTAPGVPVLQQPADSRSLIDKGGATVVTGARILIDAGETLCAMVQLNGLSSYLATDNPQTTQKLLWSGFEPYE